MKLSDLREPDGPFWGAYQEERRRERIIDNPDFVPPWFLIKLGRERLAAARVSLEQLGSDARSNLVRTLNGYRVSEDHHELAKVHAALRVLEEFVGHGLDTSGAREQVLAGLLGAQEVETARELRDAREAALDRVTGSATVVRVPAYSEAEVVEVERCTRAVWPVIWESGPEQCAYPVGHEGECAP